MTLSLGFRRHRNRQVNAVTKVLDVDFITTGTVPSTVTVARSGATATRVDATGKIVEGLAANSGRIDYDPSTLTIKGLLVEEARTQLLGTTEALGSLSVTQILSRTADVVAAPTGATTADRIIPNTTNAQHRAEHATVTADGTSNYCISVFGKNNGYGYASLRFFDTNWGYFSLDSSATGMASGTPLGQRNQDYGNGWRRGAHYNVPTAAAHIPRMNIDSGANVTSYAGDGTSGIYLWGWQLEVGKWPSSYIPNTGAAGTTVTRNADDVTSLASALLGFSGSAVSIAVEGRTGLITTEQQQTFFEIGDGTANNRISLIRDTTQHLRWQVVQGGSVEADLDLGAIGAETVFRAAIGAQANSARANLNASATIVSDPSVTLPGSLSSATLYYGRKGAGGEYCNGHIRKVRVWNGQLSDAELQQETASPPPPGQVIAFPGAVGFGALSVGGRFGTVIHVTNLNTTGTGSLTAALATSGARFIVFDVSGTIDYPSGSAVIANPYCTIAGETAPNPGIQITGYEPLVQTHDVIIRHITFAGQAPVANRDCLGLRTDSTHEVYNIVVDHCTLRWGGDENLDISTISGSNHPHDITIQYCLLYGDQGSGCNLIAENPYNITLYRNVYACNPARQPRMHSNIKVEIVNHISYNCAANDIQIGDQLATTAEPCDNSIINSRFIVGPNSNTAGALISYQTSNSTWVTGSRLYTSGITQSGTTRTVFSNPTGYDPTVSTPPISSGIAAADIMTADATFETFVLNRVGSRPLNRDSSVTSLISGIVARTADNGNIAHFGGPVTYANNTSTFNPVANPNNDDDNDGWTNIEEQLFAASAALIP